MALLQKFPVSSHACSSQKLEKAAGVLALRSLGKAKLGFGTICSLRPHCRAVSRPSSVLHAHRTLISCNSAAVSSQYASYPEQPSSSGNGSHEGQSQPQPQPRPSAAEQGCNASAAGSSERQFEFSQEELRVFKDLKDGMTECGVAFSMVALTSILLTAFQAGGQLASAPVNTVLGLRIGGLAYWLDGLIVAVLMIIGSRSFARVLRPGPVDHIGDTMEAFSRLALIVEQLAVAVCAVSLVQALQAATTWPEIGNAAASAFFFAAALRMAALLWVLVFPPRGVRSLRLPGMLRLAHAHDPGKGSAPLGNRVLAAVHRYAVRLVMGDLVSYSAVAPEDGVGPAKMGSGRYEMKAEEEQTLRVCAGAMHTAGLALLLNCFCTILLGVANAFTGNATMAASSTYSSVFKFINASFLFRASARFDEALSAGGNDAKKIMGGVNSVSTLFHRLTVTAWATVAAQTIMTVLPAVKSNPLLNMGFTTQVFGKVALLIVKLQNWVIALLGA